jgi:hypothetical protein
VNDMVHVPFGDCHSWLACAPMVQWQDALLLSVCRVYGHSACAVMVHRHNGFLLSIYVVHVDTPAPVYTCTVREQLQLRLIFLCQLLFDTIFFLRLWLLWCMCRQRTASLKSPAHQIRLTQRLTTALDAILLNTQKLNGTLKQWLYPTQELKPTTLAYQPTARTQQLVIRRVGQNHIYTVYI